MADDAHALTPYRQPRPPSEAEYDAMCAAFAETERGRWFLAEYTRRNRNADTAMVIEAIDRIEAAMARQQPPDPAPAIAAALERIIGELRERAGRMVAEDGTALEDIRRNVQKIRDVAWTLREWGTDADICDELDSQADAITEGCDRAAASPARLLALIEGWNSDAGTADSRAVPVAPPEIAATTAETAAATPAAPSPVPSPVPLPTSLGAALLAQGLVPQAVRGADAFAPLRRMSQAEKVAFFT